MRHTFKAFAYFINRTLDSTPNKYRFGEDIGNMKKEVSIEINNMLYKLILRDSGQIQLFDDNDERIVAKPLLKKYLEEKGIKITDKKTTRWYEQKIFEILEL